MSNSAIVKKTPFYDLHVAAGAKMMEFAGYMMPVRYDGDIAEHNRVRTAVGVFDVSHMGEFLVTGDGAAAFIQSVTINDISKMADTQAQYSAMCKPDGGIVDDLIVYRFQANRWMLVVNASNLEKDLNWLTSHAPANVQIRDISDATALLAVQGPRSKEVLQKLTTTDLNGIKFYWFKEGEVAGIPATISRTGYTGEKGFELYFDAGKAETMWKAVMEAGKPVGIGPAGLGARDTLRLEMNYRLYGNDMDETANPLEANLGWITKLSKGAFVGIEALQKTKADGVKRKLIGLEVEGKIPARHGYDVMHDGRKVGVVTSGTFSPSLQKAIAVAYVETPLAANGTALKINARGRELSAKVVPTPFYPGDPSSD